MSELEKWAKVADDARILFEFCEHYRISESWIYKFFDINTLKLEKERRELLDKVQQQAEEKEHNGK